MVRWIDTRKGRRMGFLNDVKIDEHLNKYL